MNEAKQEKYLGDFINNSGTIRKTVEERKNKGYGIVSEIIAIMGEIPLGRYKLEIGLKLRQAMLLNGILFNSEAWHAVSETELRMLEVVDEHLLRSLVKGHSKTPLEFLYLETGAVPIRFILSSRRLNYHHAILQRDDKELIKRVYKAQAEDPVTGDFTELLKEDFKIINEQQEDDQIRMTSKVIYKQQVKNKIKNAAFLYLKNKQQQHSKVKDIKYKNLSTQKYILSPLFRNDEVNLLYALRSRGTDCKVNFKQKYLHTNLKCILCKDEEDNQQHVLECKILLDAYKSEEITSGDISYDDIFSDKISKQKVITTLFKNLFKIRENIIEEINSQSAPSNTDVMLEMSDPLLPSIEISSFGK